MLYIFICTAIYRLYIINIMRDVVRLKFAIKRINCIIRPEAQYMAFGTYLYACTLEQCGTRIQHDKPNNKQRLTENEILCIL